jgi:hypothetical protein
MANWSFILLLFILNHNIYAQIITETSKGRDEIQCDLCETEISSDAREVNLGVLFIGIAKNDLPGYGGTGNDIEFRLKGDHRVQYSVSTSIETQLKAGNGLALIDYWKWDVVSKNINITISDANLNQKDITLNRLSKKDNCESEAKFRITIKQISTTPNASPGQYIFRVRVRVEVAGT